MEEIQKIISNPIQTQEKPLLKGLFRTYPPPDNHLKMVLLAIDSFPAASYAFPTTVCAPVETARTFRLHVTEDAPAAFKTPSRYNSDRITPTLSVAATVTFNFFKAVIIAPSAGSTIRTDGAIESVQFFTITLTTDDEATLPAGSYAFASIW